MSGSVPGPARQRQRTAGALPLQSKDIVHIRLIDQVAATTRTITRSAAAVACVFFFSRAVTAFAGQSTSVLVQLVFAMLADVRFVFALGTAAVALVVAYWQYRLRQRTIKRFHPRLKELEAMLDPNRSSSSLTPSGETNPSDREP